MRTMTLCEAVREFVGLSVSIFLLIFAAAGFWLAVDAIFDTIRRTQ